MGQKDLPLAPWQDHVRAFENLGFTRRDLGRKRGENHAVMTKTGNTASPSIPKHNPVKRGTLQKLLRRAGISEEDYLDAFNAG